MMEIINTNKDKKGISKIDRIEELEVTKGLTNTAGLIEEIIGDKTGEIIEVIEEVIEVIEEVIEVIEGITEDTKAITSNKKGIITEKKDMKIRSD